AMSLWHICETADVLVQFRIRDEPRIVRVVPFPDNRDLVGARSKMSVDAIHRHVGGTVFEPFDGDFAGIEASILHLRVRLDPVDSPSVIFPEFIWSRSRESIHVPVL